MATILSNSPNMIVTIIFGKTLIFSYENNQVSCKIVLQPTKNQYLLPDINPQKICDGGKEAIAWYNSPSPRSMLEQQYLDGKTIQYKDVNGQISIKGVHVTPTVSRILGGNGAPEDNSFWAVSQVLMDWLASHGIT